MKTTVTKTGRKMTKPLFAGYIFVKVEMTDES
jgi:transcription antitermination factor NusG